MGVSLHSLRVALLLETDGPGGAENAIFDLAEALRNRGHTVFPVGPENGDGWLGEKLRESGFETPTFGHQTNFDRIVIRDLRLIRDLTRIFKRFDVDLVHCHDFIATVHGSFAARLAGKPSILTMHGHQTMCDAWRRRAALRWAFRHSDAVVAVSQATKTQLDRDLGLTPEIIQVIRNGVPVRAGRGESIREELGVRDGELVILAVGNYVERKGHIHLLRALRTLNEGVPSPPWRLAIAGGWGGDERPKLEAFAREHYISDRVHLLTYRNDVPDLLAAADIFVMPSLWEGLPLAVLEAMQMGVCVVASETSGIPEAIVSEEHGLLVPPGDEAALANSLKRVIRDPELRNRLALAGKTRALSEFTIDSTTSSYEALYNSACVPQKGSSLRK
jgi:glycosyltransferase involved in cell wall biosynthesis